MSATVKASAAPITEITGLSVVEIRPGEGPQLLVVVIQGPSIDSVKNRHAKELAIDFARQNGYGNCGIDPTRGSAYAVYEGGMTLSADTEGKINMGDVTGRRVIGYRQDYTLGQLR